MSNCIACVHVDSGGVPLWRPSKTKLDCPNPFCDWGVCSCIPPSSAMGLDGNVPPCKSNGDCAKHCLPGQLPRCQIGRCWCITARVGPSAI